MKHTVSRPRFTYTALLHLGWMLRRLGIIAAVLLLAGSARAAVVYKVGLGAGADYPTIAAALAALAAQPQPLTQAYELRLIDDNYAENLALNATGTAVNPLTIRPAAGVSPIITGTVSFGAGSAFIIIDGNNGTTSRALTLRQPSLTAPALTFGGDASDNVVREVKIEGSNNLLSSGVVVLGNGLVGGNDRNTLTNCAVGNTDTALLPANLVYAANGGGGLNDAFSLTGNDLSNFTRTAVLVDAGNGNQWTISNNSVFYNAAAVPTTAQTAIDFRPGSGANDALVSGNFVGGRASGAVGGTWTNAGSQNFRGIVMNCGSSTVFTNRVTGNTVNQVSLTGVGSTALTALSVGGGRSELTGNTVTNVSNTGTSGVNSLVSQATTILSAFSVSSGQLMVVESGLTVVLGDLTNAGILNHTGGDILINGNFTNTGTFAQTLGDLEIKGDMLNSGQFTCSTGKVKLTGAGNQVVSGGLYFNLEVNGGGVKTFADDAQVYNGVQMLSGILNTGPFRIRLDNLANLVETETSYVLGRVEARRIPVVGATEDFGGLGLTMQPATGSVLPGSTLVSRVTGTAPSGAGGSRAILRYFDITATIPSGLNLALTMSYFTHELNGITPANLRFYKSVNAGVNWMNKGISSAGTGYAVLNSVDGFSRWTLADITAPLPVGLTAFRAERQGRNALLTWATASEQNCRGFGIEVSADGKAFRPLGFVASAEGNSSSARSYRFVDASEGKAGPRYYRLRQDDRDGTTHYYAPELVRFDAEAPTLVAYPTQFGQELTVALTAPTTEPTTLRLLDTMGRPVWQQTVAPGTQAVRPACAPGTYLLTATVAGQVLHQRVVKD